MRLLSQLQAQRFWTGEALASRLEVSTRTAHSHPMGSLAFSQEDETTMAALSLALPRTPRFSIVTPTAVLARSEGKPTSSGSPSK